MNYADVIMATTAERLIVTEKFLEGDITTDEFQKEMIAIANREGRRIVEEWQKSRKHCGWHCTFYFTENQKTAKCSGCGSVMTNPNFTIKGEQK